MTLFQTLETPTKLAILLVFTIASTAALADSRYSSRHDGYSGYNGNKWSNNSHSYPYNNSHNYSRNNSRNYRFSNRDRRNYSPAFTPNYAGNRFNSAWYSRAPYGSRASWNNRNFRRDNWSVNLNLGNSWFGNSYSYGIGYNSWYRPLSTHTTHTRVVVREPSVVVVREPVQVRHSGRSLLRDLEGNCFERSTDDRGNEVRIQLPDRACDF